MRRESRWAVEKEIPTMEDDSAGPMTAEYAEQMWKRYLRQQPRMIERFRHCMGCVHLRQAGGSYLVCCYLLQTGRKRPCAFGKECTAKVTAEGFRPPDGYEEWVAKLDRKAEKELRRVGQRGRFAQWDTQWAKGLVDRGFSISEISQIMGVNLNTLTNYGIQHLWNYDQDGRKKRKCFPKHTPEQIEAERQAFLEHQGKKKTE